MSTTKILVLTLLSCALSATQAGAQAPTLRQARQRATYQIAQIQNAIRADSAALDHARKLYAALDSMVKADSVAALKPHYDSLTVTFLIEPETGWSSLHWRSITVTAGTHVQTCVYAWWRSSIAGKSEDLCPDPPGTAGLWIDNHLAVR